MNTGIRRKVDDLGRVVIPAGIRRSLSMREGDAVEVHVEGDRVVLTKPADHCVFCHSDEELQTFREKAVCRGCVATLGGLDDRMRTRPEPEPAAAEHPSTVSRLSSWSPSSGSPDDAAAEQERGGRPRDDEERRQDPPASTTAW